MTTEVLCVVGARPNFMKIAPIMAAFPAQSIAAKLVHTGQHYDPAMSEGFFDQLGIPRPDVNLEVGSASHAVQTADIMRAFEPVLDAEPPRAILVVGDVNSTIACALVAAKKGIPVIHVEAGLRSNDRTMPEEINRVLTDQISDLLYTTERSALDNLLREGIPAAHCHVTGNTVIDALLATRTRIGGIEASAIGSRLGIAPSFVASHLAAPKSRWILVTGHRRESFGPGFENLCRGIRQLVDSHPDLGVVYPVHLNPLVQEPVRRLLGGHPRIALAAPAAYEDFVWLMDRSTFVLTDSGGVQEEAPSLGKPVLVMRENTERPEGLAAGTSELVGTDPVRIVAAATRLLSDPAEYARRSQLRNPYGDGTAAAKIARVMEAAI